MSKQGAVKMTKEELITNLMVCLKPVFEEQENPQQGQVIPIDEEAAMNMTRDEANEAFGGPENEASPYTKEAVSRLFEKVKGTGNEADSTL